MSFEVVAKDLAGRVGRLRTRKGTLETPALAPVVNPFKSTISIKEIEEIGFKFVITNAYIIWRRYGELGKELKLDSILGTSSDVVIMTDSGAYQLMEYGYIDVSPDQILLYQLDIGSDIAVILDIPTRPESSRRAVWLEVEETIRRAMRALAVKSSVGSDTLLVGPIQGGTHLDILRYSARKMSKLPFDIYAVGSPTRLLAEYEFSKVVDMIVTVKSEVPLSKPVHLFGAGHPIMLALAVALGCDLFDSASYILYARDGRYMTPHGTYRLSELKVLPCNCPVCRKYTVEDLLELPSHERERELAKHNLYVLKYELDSIKQAIYEGRLWELLEVRCRSHPGLYRALKKLRKYRKYIEELDPVTGGEIRGIFLYEGTSYFRPEVERHRYRVLNLYEPPARDVLIVVTDVEKKPFHIDPSVRKILSELSRVGALNRVHVLVFYPPFGPIPLEVDDVYPLSQNESYVSIVSPDTKRAIDTLARYLRKFCQRYRKVLVVGKVTHRYLGDALTKKLSMLDIEVHDLDPRLLAERVRKYLKEISTSTR
ncbi:MAG: tRNA guanosine(15) transglycosylase TgtA [Thermoprotei archaeon]|nr:MAG: tRNA guanosine(15) transglycosylase TgtA [Thermoprotei archaeon]